MRAVVAMFASIAAVAVVSPVFAQSDAFERAREEFEDGVRRLDAREYDAAAAAFERSLAHRESLSALYNLALAYQGLGKIKLALASLGRHLARARADAAHEDVAQAEKLIVELKASLASVELTLAAPAELVRVDGEPVGSKEGVQVILLDPGRHIFEAERAGYEVDRAELTLAPGSVSQVSLAPARALPPPAPIAVAPREPEAESVLGAWWFWTALGVVVVAAVAGGVAIAGGDEPNGGKLGMSFGALGR